MEVHSKLEPDFVNVYISNQKKWIEDLVAKQVMFETRVQLAESKISQLTEQLSVATKQNQEYTEDLSATKYKLEEQLENVSNANRDKEALSAQIANLTREATKFQDLLTNAKLDVNRGTEKNHLLHKQIDELVQINRQQQVDLDKLREDNARLASENTSLNGELFEIKKLNNVDIKEESIETSSTKKRKSEHSDTTSNST
jgi:chromosome segregation ATPase